MRQLGLKDTRGLIALIKERKVKKGDLSAAVRDRLLEANVAFFSREGTSKYIETTRPELVRGIAADLAGTENLDDYLHTLDGMQVGIKPSRTSSAQLTNDTKAFGKDVMNGIRLNVIKPIEIKYDGVAYALNPLQGMCMEVDEQAILSIAPEVVVVGVENYSTFMRIKDYAYLFTESCDYLFTYRVTSDKETYGKWITWLKRIPNRYIHFGDLDKGGLKIYIDSFRSVLGERAEFLIPDGFEELIRKGSKKLYNEQMGQAAPDVSKDPRIKPLMDVIEKYHRCCEQEKLASI